MSHHLSDWILANAENLSLQVEDLQWVQKPFTGLHDIHASILIGNKRYEGRGSADSKDLAIIKAVAEAIERAVCLQSLPTTNGVAAHIDLEQAKKNAQNELLERDLFLSHFLTQTAFDVSTEWTAQLSLDLREDIGRAGDSIQIFRMRRNSHGQGFVCLIRGGMRWGGIMGLSFGQGDEHSLVMKAALEACRYYWHRRSHRMLTENHSLESFLSLSDWKYADNGRLGLNVDYFSKISHLFPESTECESGRDFVDYRSADFSFRELPVDLPELRGGPMKIVHCSADHIQPLLPGPFGQNEISQPGLLRFTNGREFVLENLPHPID